MLFATTLVATHSLCASQQINAIKGDGQALKLDNGTKALTCRIDMDFESFRYSGDREFLIFKRIEKGFYAPFYTEYINLNDAYSQCIRNSRVRALRNPAGANILDVNAAGRIYLTYLNDMHNIGGDAMSTQTSYAVWRLPKSKEVIFPFSVRKHDSETIAMQRISLLGSAPIDEFDAIPDGTRHISVDGKYIDPAGLACRVGEQYESVWSVDTRKEISAKELDALKRKNIQCNDLFGKKGTLGQ